MALNLIGAIATGSTVLIVIVAKFSDGAWITLLAIPRLLFTYGVHRHYEKVRREIDLSRPLLPDLPRAPQASKASLEEGKWLTSSRLASLPSAILSLYNG